MTLLHMDSRVKALLWSLYLTHPLSSCLDQSTLLVRKESCRSTSDGVGLYVSVRTSSVIKWIDTIFNLPLPTLRIMDLIAWASKDIAIMPTT